MKVIEGMNRSIDVRAVVDDVSQQVDSLDGVIVLGLYKDGSQLLRTSNMSGMEKSFLCQFFTAWMAKWFQLEQR